MSQQYAWTSSPTSIYMYYYLCGHSTRNPKMGRMMNLAGLLGWSPLSMVSPWSSLSLTTALLVQLKNARPGSSCVLLTTLEEDPQIQWINARKELDTTVDTSNCGPVPESGRESPKEVWGEGKQHTGK